MNPIDNSLWRLFKAAAQTPKSPDEPMPFGLEARVLARWHSLPNENELSLLAGLFRRALICAGIVMVLSVVWSSCQNTNIAASVTALANYEINTHIPL